MQTRVLINDKSKIQSYYINSLPKSGNAAKIALQPLPKTLANEKSLSARNSLENRLKQEVQPKLCPAPATIV